MWFEDWPIVFDQETGNMDLVISNLGEHFFVRGMRRHMSWQRQLAMAPMTKAKVKVVTRGILSIYRHLSINKILGQKHIDQHFLIKGQNILWWDGAGGSVDRRGNSVSVFPRRIKHSLWENSLSWHGALYPPYRNTPRYLSPFRGELFTLAANVKVNN